MREKLLNYYLMTCTIFYLGLQKGKIKQKQRRDSNYGRTNSTLIASTKRTCDMLGELHGRQQDHCLSLKAPFLVRKSATHYLTQSML
jgi:hypothetical protein